MCQHKVVQLHVYVCFQFLSLFNSVVSNASFSESVSGDKDCKLAMATSPTHTTSVALQLNVTMLTCIVLYK